ncbi:hypothetical protein L3X39_00005 [Sabulilitoribacter multivorans]|uniref:Uncharacterized protein n=1 Tax=Flaviramulus multivorans TaxID=1304750 RepID=A0ABS9IDX4_9FLAO|nr:hypothetical protein [Flaviramulus multivorans]MCF7559002.1 hypothetical protein [Flaviramulus multivorans]
MEHLALHTDLILETFCRRVAGTLATTDFQFDHENETEWGEAKTETFSINISKPYEKGVLQQWDSTVPEGCNVGISVTGLTDLPLDIETIGRQIADEFNTSVFHHRTWLEPGKNLKREKEIKTSHNKS